jgi:acyl carrier protein
MNELELELKRLIVSALALEDVEPTSIDAEAPLFGEGLGLDSIDALELSVVLSREYGVSIKADDAQNRDIFSSVRSLAAFVSANRSSAGRSPAGLATPSTSNPAT